MISMFKSHLVLVMKIGKELETGRPVVDLFQQEPGRTSCDLLKCFGAILLCTEFAGRVKWMGFKTSCTLEDHDKGPQT